MEESESKVKITIDADTKGADQTEAALGRVAAAAKKANSSSEESGGAFTAFGKRVTQVFIGLRSVIGKFMQSLGTIGLVIAGINFGIEVFKRLQESIDYCRESAHRFYMEWSKRSFANSVNQQKQALDNYNKSLAQSIELAKKRNEEEDKTKARARDLEDARSESRKQLEIARLDPADANFAKRKAEIERKYEAQSINVEALRNREDLKEKLKRNEDAQYDSYFNIGRLEKQIRETKELAERAFKIKDWDKKAELDKVVRGFEDRLKEEKERYVALRREGLDIQDEGTVLSDARLNARRIQMENDERARQAAEVKENKEKARRTEDARARRAMQNEIDALNPADEDYESKKSEIQMRYRVRAAEVNVARTIEDHPDDTALVGNAYTDLRQAQNDARVKAITDRDKGLSSFLGGVMSADAVSQNRLTALGLGSGVSAKGDVSGDIRRIIDILTKGNKISESINDNLSNNSATFAE